MVQELSVVRSTVGSNKLVVLSGSGNTTMAGTVDIAGRTIIDDTLNVTQGVDFDSTLNVDGAATDSTTQSLLNSTTIKDDFVLRGASKTLTLQNGSGTDKITLHSNKWCYHRCWSLQLQTLSMLQLTPLSVAHWV